MHSEMFVYVRGHFWRSTYTSYTYLSPRINLDVQMYDSAVSSADETSQGFSDKTTLHNHFIVE